MCTSNIFIFLVIILNFELLFLLPDLKVAFSLRFTDISSFGFVQFLRCLSNIVFVELILKLHVGSLMFGPDMGISVITGDKISRRVRLVGHVQVEIKQISISFTITQRVIEFAFFLSNTIWSRQSGLCLHLLRLCLMFSSSS